MYSVVLRDWANAKINEGQPAVLNGHPQEASSGIMERWRQETMRDQPFHGIGAVAKAAASGEPSQRSRLSNSHGNWSLQHIGHVDNCCEGATLEQVV
jgi:hypothetical protein